MFDKPMVYFVIIFFANLPDYLSINLFVCCRILIIIFIFRQFWVDGRLSFDKTVRKKELCTLSLKKFIEFIIFFKERSWSVGGWSRLHKADLDSWHILRQRKSCEIPCSHSRKPISQNYTQRRNTSQVIFLKSMIRSWIIKCTFNQGK